MREMIPSFFLTPVPEVQHPPAMFAKLTFRATAGESPSLEKDPGYNGHGGP
jgi:hypothetical protein